MATDPFHLELFGSGECVLGEGTLEAHVTTVVETWRLVEGKEFVASVLHIFVTHGFANLMFLAGSKARHFGLSQNLGALLEKKNVGG